MSNSGPVSGVPAPRPPQNVLEPNARVASVPTLFGDLKTPVKVEGQVIAQNKDGSVRVQTAQGNVDIVTPRPPAEGQRVEVTLLPGRPPRQAVVQDAPPQQQPQSSPQTSGQTQAPAPAPPQPTTTTRPAPAPETQAPVPPRGAETPVNVEVKPAPVPPTVPVQAPVPVTPIQTALPVLEPDAVVTLLPLTPTHEEQIVYPAPQQAVENIVQSVVSAAQNIVADITNDLGVTGAQIVSFLPDTLPDPLQALPSRPALTPNTVTTLLNETPLSLPQGAPVLTAPQQTLPLQQVQLPGIPSAPPVIAQPATPSLLTNESVFTPSLFTAPIRVQIQTITPPDAVLHAPADGKPGLFAPQGEIKPILFQDGSAVKTLVVTGTLQQHPVVTLLSPEGTPLQNLWMQVPSDGVAAGTQLQITPPGSQAAPLILPNLTGVPLPLSFLTPEPWPLMEQITQALAQIAPQAAQALANITPNPASPARFGPAALFFFAAVRAGDMANWIGEKTIDILRRDGRSGLLSRLTQESSALNRLSSEPVSGDWRAVSVPLYYQGEMQKMALYYRHEEEGGGEGADKNAFTRFIFDLNLSRMGKVQVDGLFRPKKLDLILRTEKSFGSVTQMQLRRTYVNALEQTDLSGELSFQSRPDQWMSITPDNKDMFSSAI